MISSPLDFNVRSVFSSLNRKEVRMNTGSNGSSMYLFFLPSKTGVYGFLREKHCCKQTYIVSGNSRSTTGIDPKSNIWSLAFSRVLELGLPEDTNKNDFAIVTQETEETLDKRTNG